MSKHHPAYLGHHYDTPEQQFSSGKLGMWIFLATEILLFGGLFCAYAIYRHHHPEVFVYADRFLDRKLGGINTIVLICSSLTMAMAVRSAQVGNRRLLVGLLIVTLLCGFGFLGIKKVEYEHKWKHGLLWGKKFNPEEEHGEGGSAPGQDSHGASASGEHDATAAHPATPNDLPSPAGGSSEAATEPASMLELRSNIPEAAQGPPGLAEAHPRNAAHTGPGPRPNNVHLFFGIYFLMTGLHGLHVIAGMVAITWVLIRSVKGHFTPEYSTPVDLVGLYWHLVDLIWIYLFPLLYLIH